MPVWITHVIDGIPEVMCEQRLILASFEFFLSVSGHQTLSSFHVGANSNAIVDNYVNF